MHFTYINGMLVNLSRVVTIEKLGKMLIVCFSGLEGDYAEFTYESSEECLEAMRALEKKLNSCDIEA